MSNRNPVVILLVALIALFFCVTACTQDDDGVLPLSSGDDYFFGVGFFRKAELDSGARIHLASDTLFLQMGYLWTFANCALKEIEIDKSREGQSLVISPKVILEYDGEDCPAPYYHPDTVLSLMLDEDEMEDVSQILVRNDEDSLLDSILLRRGKFELDTFNFFVDSLFDSVHALPLRTKDSPSIMRVLDSLAPRVFYWRPMKSDCELRVDMCDSVVNDTIFPSSWDVNDTALVPMRKLCALGDSVYCVSARWVNDSTKLGDVQERADTVWHTSLYYVEKIPECASVNSISFGAFALDHDFTIVRELRVPDRDETFCGPAARKDLFVYDIQRMRFFPDSLDVDSLYGIWKSEATVVK